MDKRLYVVDITSVAYVVAESEEEAVKVARENRSDIMGYAEWTARLNGRMPIHWDDEDYPYGDDDERTLAEWRKAEDSQS